MSETWYVVSGAWQERNLWAGIDMSALVRCEGELPEWQLQAAYSVGGGQLDRSRIPIRMMVQEVHYGKGRPDFIWAGTDPIKLVSTQLAEVLDRHQFTGYDLYEVPFVDRKGQPIEGYRGLHVRRFQNGLPDLRPYSSGSFLAQEAVIDALIGAGVKKFQAEEADQYDIELADWCDNPKTNPPPTAREEASPMPTIGPSHKRRFLR